METATETTIFKRLAGVINRFFGGGTNVSFGPIPTDHPEDRCCARRQTEFRTDEARESVIDLGHKVKYLKECRRDLKRQHREGVEKPTILWHDSTLLGMQQIVEKTYTRSKCARAWNLAYAFARGKPYRKVERDAHTRLWSGTIAECLAEITTVPGIKSSLPDGEFRFYGNNPQEVKDYLNNLKDRVEAWYAVE